MGDDGVTFLLEQVLVHSQQSDGERVEEGVEEAEAGGVEEADVGEVAVEDLA